MSFFFTMCIIFLITRQQYVPGHYQHGNNTSNGPYMTYMTTMRVGQIHGFKPSQATTMKIHWNRQQCLIGQLSLFVIKCSFIPVSLHFLVRDCQMWKSAQSSAAVAQKLQRWGKMCILTRPSALYRCTAMLFPFDHLLYETCLWHFSNTVLWVFIEIKPIFVASHPEQDPDPSRADQFWSTEGSVFAQMTRVNKIIWLVLTAAKHHTCAWFKCSQ